MLLAFLLSITAHAYENDPVTTRLDPPGDATTAANARFRAMLQDAVNQFNRRCDQPDDPARRRMARLIRREAGAGQRVYGRGLQKSMGYSRFSAFLETADIPRHESFQTGMFNGLRLQDSIVLSTAGPASIVRVNGVLVGTDKFDHFIQTGFAYTHKRDPIRWGTWTERSVLGLFTSNAFSYGDLRANHDGMTFYLHLFEGGSAIQRDEDGCAQVDHWDWSHWIDDEYDEFYNVPVFGRHVDKVLRRRLEERKDELCALDWSEDLEVQSVVLARETEYAGKKAKNRDDAAWVGLCR
jgi:hypothetical protein